MDSNEVIYNKNGWFGELFWCPSQIEKTFKICNNNYKVHLRWRHNDPWEIQINNEYIELVNEYKQSEYELLIEYIENNIKELIRK